DQAPYPVRARRGSSIHNRYRQDLYSAKDQTGANLRRRREVVCREIDRKTEVRGEGDMSVLVILEQQSGKWHRMSWETLAAGQQFAAALGKPVEAAVVGHGVAALAAEAATKKLAKVYAVDHELLKDYTADAYSAAVDALIRKVNPAL